MALFGPTVLRLAVGVVFAAHGAQKLFKEFNLALAGALASLMLTGPGAFSIDRRRARAAEAQAFGRARMRAGQR